MENQITVRTASPISKKLALAFGAVSALAALTSLVHVLLVRRVADAVEQMQHDEHAIRQGLELARSIREQYIHVAHTIVAGDRSHMDHYSEWVGRAQTGAAQLRAMVPEELRARLDRVVEGSRALDDLFRDALLPAVEHDDRASVRKIHDKVIQLSLRTVEDADAIARSFEQDMSRVHVDTNQMTRWGLGLASLGIALIVGVGLLSTVRLRRLVIKPLQRLTEAASEVGRGAFDTRLGNVGEGEFRELAGAFDRMATELRQREVQLVESARLAAIGQLAAGVAHEINNPIGIIRGYLRTMLPEAADPDLREELSILDEEAASCQRITEDLLTYARTPELTREPVEIANLVEETVHRFTASADAAATELEVNCRPATLSGDPVRLKQVLTNLLKNAVQANAHEVEITGDLVEPSAYRIRVADRGTGMTAEQRASAFEPFFTGRKGGTGLGLAVCQGIVRAHDGSISVAPRNGGGTVFEITLPA